MSHSDDLDELDAELEIALKHEYVDVFPLFAYCVVTEEATYLCNQVKLDCVPTPGYMLFELQMHDVWVWDRNRPRRIIPHARIYTTSDVSVEQLKEVDSPDVSCELPDNVVEQLRQAELAGEAADDEENTRSEDAAAED